MCRFVSTEPVLPSHACRETPDTTLFRSLTVAAHDEEEKVKTEPGAGASTRGKSMRTVATAKLAATLRDYFFLDELLVPLYRRWSEGDSRMAAVAACIPGVRVVR